MKLVTTALLQGPNLGQGLTCFTTRQEFRPSILYGHLTQLSSLTPPACPCPGWPVHQSPALAGSLRPKPPGHLPSPLSRGSWLMPHPPCSVPWGTGFHLKEAHSAQQECLLKREGTSTLLGAPHHVRCRGLGQYPTSTFRSSHLAARSTLPRGLLVWG